MKRCLTLVKYAGYLILPMLGMTVLLFTPFAVRYESAISDFIQIVEHNVNLRIADGHDPTTVYPQVIKEVFEMVQQAAGKERARVEAMSPPGQAIDGRLVLTVGKLLDARRSPSLKRIRKNLLAGVHRYVVYIVRNDAEGVLYVGATHYNAEHRIRQHVNGRSALGNEIRKHKPHSDSWTVEMLAQPDWKTALAKEEELTTQLRPTLCARFLKNVGDNNDSNANRDGTRSRNLIASND